MENGNTKIYAIYITIIIILLLGITGIFLYFNKSTSPSRAAIKESTKQTTSTKNQKAMPTMKEMPMTAVTPSPVSEQQK